VTSRPAILFVVATPIGNLGDLSARAVDTLRASDLILAEDTRRTRQLLSHFAIPGKRVERFDAHATGGHIARFVDELRNGTVVSLVTDAGTPTVSDPGAALVREAIEAGARVVPIPGPSAALAALVGSGLSGDGRFRFVGFLPRSGSARLETMAAIAATPEPVVLFESAARLGPTLSELAAATPDRPACVARELTKVHEEFVRGTCAALASDAREWLGEIAVVLGPHAPEERAARVDDAALDRRIDEALAAGEHARSLAEKLAAWSGRPRRAIYERVVARKAQRE
jgi:16S rRNA (cytidine1402-2'-O)-methyltransferase